MRKSMDDEIVDLTDDETLPDEFDMGAPNDHIVPLLQDDDMPDILRRLDYYRAKENSVKAKAKRHIDKARAEAEDYTNRELNKTHARRVAWNESIARKFIQNKKASVKTMHFPTGTIKRMSRKHLVIIDEERALEELRASCPAAITTIPETVEIDTAKALKYCRETGDVLDDAITIEGTESYTINTAETERIKEEKKKQKEAHTLTQKD